MDERKAANLRERVMASFPKALPPTADDITAHRCEECDGVRDDFKGIEWWNASSELIFSNFGQLPLFTPAAYHYYLPAYILYALSKPEGDEVLEFLIYSWGPSRNELLSEYLLDRKSTVTPDQKEIIRDFLELVLSDERHVYDYADARRALDFCS